MTNKTAMAIGAGLFALVAPSTVSAQAAAESAVINATVGPAAGAASTSLGNSINRSMRGAAARIRTTGSASSRGGVSVTPSGGSRFAGATGMTIGTGDVLQGTDAPSYTLSNGATIRVSGGMAPARPAPKSCEGKDCPAGEAPE